MRINEDTIRKAHLDRRLKIRLPNEEGERCKYIKSLLSHSSTFTEWHFKDLQVSKSSSQLGMGSEAQTHTKNKKNYACTKQLTVSAGGGP